MFRYSIMRQGLNRAGFGKTMTQGGPPKLSDNQT